MTGPMDPGLDDAYAIRSPEDSLRVYRDWAETYDTGFATRMAYRLPALVAAAFARAGGAGPVLDAGAGTGLLGMALAGHGIAPVDGIDLSPEMLAVARTKGCYRGLWTADLTRPLPPLPGPYAGVVSSGTFTYGHVGAGALRPLVDLCGPGAILAFSVNTGVWDSGGFGPALAALAPALAEVTMTDEDIYADAPDAAHRADRARIVTLRRI